MSSTFTIKKGVRYRFYVSSALLKGRKNEAGSVPRVSSHAIETAVLRVVRAKFDCDGLSPAQCADQHVRQVIVQDRRLMITVKSGGDVEPTAIEVHFTTRLDGSRSEIDQSGTNRSHRAPNPLLAQAIVRAHDWLKSLSDGTYDSIDDLGRRLNLHPKVIRKGLRLAFLSPAIAKGVLVGDQRGARLLGDLDQVIALSWHEQSEIISLRPSR
jgi:hypothetical protein